MVDMMVYTVNCNNKNTVAKLGVVGGKKKTWDVLACQEMGAAISEDDFDPIARSVDTAHGLDVGLFIGKGTWQTKWQLKEAKILVLPGNWTGRGVAMASLSCTSNSKVEVWIASIHCKSGQGFTKTAQEELNTLLNYLLGLAVPAGPKAVIMTGDINWGSVRIWRRENISKIKHYECKSLLGGDQKSGRSLMQTIIFYSSSEVSEPRMGTLGQTDENHAVIGAQIDVTPPGDKRKREDDVEDLGSRKVVKFAKMK